MYRQHRVKHLNCKEKYSISYLSDDVLPYTNIATWNNNETHIEAKMYRYSKIHKEEVKNQKQNYNQIINFVSNNHWNYVNL